MTVLNFTAVHPSLLHYVKMYEKVKSVFLGIILRKSRNTKWFKLIIVFTLYHSYFEKSCNKNIIKLLLSVISTLVLVLQYTTYIPRERGSALCYPFVFTDIMGLDPTLGLLVDDVEAALRGHVKDGYEVRSSPGLSVFTTAA